MFTNDIGHRSFILALHSSRAISLQSDVRTPNMLATVIIKLARDKGQRIEVRVSMNHHCRHIR